MEDNFLYQMKSGNLTLDERGQRLFVNNENIVLEPYPFELLRYLMRRPREIIKPIDVLGERCGNQVVLNTVSKIRFALGDKKTLIKNHRSKGYSFEGDVIRVVLSGQPVGASDIQQKQIVPGLPYYTFKERISQSQHADVWSITEQYGENSGYLKVATSDKGVSLIRNEIRVVEKLLNSSAKGVISNPLETSLQSPLVYLAVETHGTDLLRFSQGGQLSSMTPTNKLNLIARIIEAIVPLHAQGFIHADIKPENLLIKVVEDDFDIRVIDFTHSLFENDTGVTSDRKLQLSLHSSGQQQAIVGSINYIAKEIIQGQLPTRASDVYSLGVIIYQIITDDIKSPMPTNWKEFIDDPILQSDIAKYTHPNPEKRAQSAKIIQENLNAFPARKAKFEKQERINLEHAMQAQKLEKINIRRPWIITAFSAASIALIIAVSAALLYRDASNSEKEARLVAEHEFTAAEEARNFLQDILATADVDNPGPVRDATVKDAMLLVSEKLKAGDIKDPRTRIMTYDVIINVLVGQRDISKAMETATEAIAYMDTQSPKFPASRASYRLRMAEWEFRKGNIAGAEVLSKEAEEILKTIESPDDKLLGTLAFLKGRALYMKGQYADTIPFFKETLKHQNNYEEDIRTVVMSHVSLVDSFYQTGQKEMALKHVQILEEPRFSDESLLPVKSILSKMFIQARVQNMVGRNDKAIPILQSGLALAQENYPNLWDTGQFHAELGSYLNEIGNFTESRKHYEMTREIACEQFGVMSWFCPFLEGMVAIQDMRLGDHAGAANTITQVISDIEITNPPGREVMRYYLVQAYYSSGDYDAAREQSELLDFELARSTNDDGLWDIRKDLLTAVIEGHETWPAIPKDMRDGEKDWYQTVLGI